LGEEMCKKEISPKIKIPNSKFQDPEIGGVRGNVRGLNFCKVKKTFEKQEKHQRCTL